MASIRNALMAIDAPFSELSVGPLPDPDKQVFILPGVGSFAEASASLKRRRFDTLGFIQPKILGICLGMQLLFNDSNEGGVSPGLGLLKGSVRQICEDPAFETNLRLPHVGWQQLQTRNSQVEMDLGYTLGEDVYFVHSFMAVGTAATDVWGTVAYGNVTIPAVVARDGVVGFQFHPEKSGQAGLLMLKKTINYLFSQV